MKCRRDHVDARDMVLKPRDQKAIRTLLESGDSIPVSPANLFKLIQDDSVLEDRIKEQKNNHQTMVKLQILGLVDPKYMPFKRKT